MPQSGRNIVICCDGTANEPLARGGTNVFELVGLLRGFSDQLVYYDPGLGTESAPGAQTWAAKKTTEVLGLAFGYGLKRNISDAYTFLMDHYEPGDRIYLFGFSRGAYTVRALAGMLHTVGLLEKGSGNLLYYALKKYTQQGKREWENIGAFKGTLCRQLRDTSPRFAVPIHFLGVWDTVKSVGLFRRSVQLPFTRALPNVRSARHAVALDEKRSKYRPNLWTASGGFDGDVKTVWFSGVHADVGGGYPATERGLADISLEWMVDSAEEHELLLNRERFETARRKRIDDASECQDASLNDAGNGGSRYKRTHNPLLPIWWIAGWWRRKLPERAWIHESVIDGNKDRRDSWEKGPLGLVHRVKNKDVAIEGDVLLLRQGKAVLIQVLRPGEQSYFESNGLPDNAEEAMRGLRLAGLEQWQKTVSDCFSRGVIDASAASQEKARNLLIAAGEAIIRDDIKGEGGAFECVKTFLRMRSLKSAGKRDIVASAPYLLESLAEHSSKKSPKPDDNESDEGRLS